MRKRTSFVKGVTATSLSLTLALTGCLAGCSQQTSSSGEQSAQETASEQSNNEATSQENTEKEQEEQIAYQKVKFGETYKTDIYGIEFLSSGMEKERINVEDFYGRNTTFGSVILDSGDRAFYCKIRFRSEIKKEYGLYLSKSKIVFNDGEFEKDGWGDIQYTSTRNTGGTIDALDEQYIYIYTTLTKRMAETVKSAVLYLATPVFLEDGTQTASDSAYTGAYEVKLL